MEGNIYNALIGVAFWIFIILVTIVPIVLHFRSRLETEKTIRLAIERGQQLDPQVIEKLLTSSRRMRGSHGMRSREEMRASGTICIGAGVGLYLFGWLGPVSVLMGVGPLVGCIGIAMLVGSMFLPSATPDERTDRKV